jgi:alpha-ribazole phosphatase
MQNDIYLIRHTTPAVAKGICYGQTDLDVTASFGDEAEAIRRVLPVSGFGAVYSSPLQRCSRLAGELFPDTTITLRPELMELHCGSWEMQPWDDLPKDEIGPWMADFVNIRVPGGESYLDLHARVTSCFQAISAADAGGPQAIVAHGGPIRSILAGVTGTPLSQSFQAFSLHYGCVVRLRPTADGFHHEILWNNKPEEREQHKPSTYYKKFT